MARILIVPVKLLFGLNRLQLPMILNSDVTVNNVRGQSFKINELNLISLCFPLWQALCWLFLGLDKKKISYRHPMWKDPMWKMLWYPNAMSNKNCFVWSRGIVLYPQIFFFNTEIIFFYLLCINQRTFSCTVIFEVILS